LTATPPAPFRIPPGVRFVRVDHDSGLPSSGGNSIDEAVLAVSLAVSSVSRISPNLTG